MGYLGIGHCPNGDYVVMNVERHFGAIGYICHEECAADNEFEDISECSKVVAPSLGDFAVGLDQKKLSATTSTSYRRRHPCQEAIQALGSLLAPPIPVNRSALALPCSSQVKKSS